MASIDTSVHAAATGEAAELVAQHAEELPLKLWAAWFCPFVQRAWIALEEKRIAYQYIEVNPYRKEPALMQLNPRGLVPVLVLSGGDEQQQQQQQQRVLTESAIMCEYLDEAYADEAQHGPRLLPADPFERARARIWIDHVSSRIVPAFYRFLQHTPSKDYTLASARDALLGHLETFAGAMDPAGPWFLGARISLVDVSLAPWVGRLFLLDHYKEGGAQVPGGAEAGGAWARWHAWAAAVGGRESVRRTTSERERYVKAYERYADDSTKSQVGQATRQGTRLP